MNMIFCPLAKSSEKIIRETIKMSHFNNRVSSRYFLRCSRCCRLTIVELVLDNRNRQHCQQRYRIQINFSETLQEIRSVEKNKLITMITVAYTKINKLWGFTSRRDFYAYHIDNHPKPDASMLIHRGGQDIK